MKRNYYYLISSLPDWKLDDRKPALNSLTFREMLGQELHVNDFKLVEWLYLPFDHTNILNKLYKKDVAFDTRGGYPVEVVEKIVGFVDSDSELDCVVERYIEEFLLAYFNSDNKPPRHEAEKILVDGWFRLLQASKNNFLVHYADFEMQSRNIFTALLGRKFNIAVADSFVGDHDMIEALKKNRTRDFGLSGEVNHFELLLQVFEIANLQEREMKLDLMRWNFFEEITFFEYFTVEKILSFVLKLFIVERWNSLDEKQGRELFEKLIAELQDSYVFAEEYKFNHGKKR